MNKGGFFILTIALLFGLLVVPAEVIAYSNFDITNIRGQIHGPDGNPFKHASVTVECDGKTKTDRTNGNGKYHVIFIGRNTCDAGDTATITASKDGVSGSATGTVVEKRDGRFVDRNFSVVNMNVSVPEFGFLPGVIALVSSAGAFYALKKKV